DAVERQTEGRRYAQVSPEYEIMIVKPRMLNHGLGYHSRYFVSGSQATPALDQYDLDQYRASEMAFGHAGFLDDGAGLSTNGIMREHAFEYWLVQAVQRHYAEAAPVAVRYHDGSAFVDLGAAVRAGLDRRRARLVVEYANGLQLFVNRDAASGGISSNAGFSHRQGRDGFGYFEVDETATPDTWRPLQWDPVQQRWQGQRTYSLLHAFGGHPDHTAVVRTWTSPIDGTVRVRGTAQRPTIDAGCGDGVNIRIALGSSTLWSVSIAAGDTSEKPFDLNQAVTAGDRVEFWISEGANNLCDSTTLSPEITWQDSAYHDWNLFIGSRDYVLPPSGWVALAPDGLRAYSALVGGQRTEYVEDSQYRFARVRGGALRTVEDLATDGAIALVGNALGGVDLHGLGLTRAERAGALLLLLSERGDVNVRFVDARTAQLAVRDAASAGTVDLTLAGLPAAWLDVLAAQPDAIERRQLDAVDTAVGSPLPLIRNGDGSLSMPALEVGRRYQLRVTAECVAASECSAQQTCSGGRCVAGGLDGGVDDAGAGDAAGAERSFADATAQEGGAADASGGEAGGRDSATAVDAGTGSPPTRAVAETGCGCRTVSRKAAPWPAVALTALLVVASALRRRWHWHRGPEKEHARP
ncbi:MAG: hypothetical protein JXR83_06505, partial [Deltaproteobacteria bacterium]|nr:hypothetical protein [Deltaproteobacteria bacterium]